MGSSWYQAKPFTTEPTEIPENVSREPSAVALRLCGSVCSLLRKSLDDGPEMAREGAPYKLSPALCAGFAAAHRIAAAKAAATNSCLVAAAFAAALPRCNRYPAQ